METKVRRWSSLILRFLIGGVFVYAGVAKALDPAAFLKDIGNYQLLPNTAAVLVALYLPFLEILCGVSVVVKRLYTGALGILSLMMLVFIGALVSAWARGLNIECGCFGSGGGPGHYGLTLVRDGAFLAALGFLITGEIRRLRAV